MREQANINIVKLNLINERMKTKIKIKVYIKLA